MTPLAQSLARQLCSPVAKRSTFWRENAETLRSSLSDVHCFEISQVLPLISEIRGISEEHFNSLLFLPAPKTWIEWRNPSLGERIGLLVEEGKERHLVTAFFAEMASHIGHVDGNGRNYPSEADHYIPTSWANQSIESINRFDAAILSMVHWALLFINSPKIIGRQQKMPHKGLERELLKSRSIVGQFPLHAWTEIQLRATAPYLDDTGIEHEAHLTGSKCLHFCRQHLRVRLGKLELVSAHWRGDAALGIKRSRYVVRP